jgi:hypothetical protein
MARAPGDDPASAMIVPCAGALLRSVEDITMTRQFRRLLAMGALLAGLGAAPAQAGWHSGPGGWYGGGWHGPGWGHGRAYGWAPPRPVYVPPPVIVVPRAPRWHGPPRGYGPWYGPPRHGPRPGWHRHW